MANEGGNTRIRYCKYGNHSKYITLDQTAKSSYCKMS